MPQPGNPLSQVSSFWIKVNGRSLPDTVFARVVEVVLEQDLVLPDAFLIRLNDVEDAGEAVQARFPTANDTVFGIGQSVEIGMGREEQPRSNLQGEITSIDLEAHADGVPMLTVRGYDKAHRLHRVKKTRSFENQTYSDIARQIAQESGLGSANIDSTSVVYDYLAQDGQTDWELLRNMARKCGFELFATGSQLYFRQPMGTEKAPEQQFGMALREVRLRISATSQAKSVEVRGWDASQKKAFVGIATSPASVTGTDRGDHGGAAAARAFGGDGKYLLTTQTLTSHQEADNLAQALLDEIAGSFVQLECVCLGDADLRPGRTVQLSGLGTRFNKDYYISAATHRTTAELGYMTQLTVSGRQPTSVSALLGAGTNGASGPSAPAAAKSNVVHPGVVVGVVSNNKDEQMGGRIKVSFPWLGDRVESTWARIATPLAGNGRGMYWLPEVNDEVLLAFEHGDINRPYVLGYLWNGVDKVPKPANAVVAADGKVNQRIIHTPSGHTVVLDDSPDSPGISVIDKTGNNKILIDSSSNKLTLTVAGDMDLLASSGTISIKARTIAIEATNNASMKGTQDATVEGTSTTNVKGARINVKASGTLTLDGGPQTEVKGGMIRLN